MEKTTYARADGVQLNTIQRFYGVLVFPRTTLQDIIDNPGFFRGLACLLGLILIFTLATLPKIKAYTIWAIEKQSLHVAAVARDVSVYGAMAAVVLTSIAQSLLFFFVTALLVFLFGYTTKKQASYRVLLAVCVFAYVPVAVAAFLQSVLIMIRPAESLLDITTSLAMFLPAGEGGLLYKVLSLVEPLDLWAVSLVALGGSIAMETELKKAAAFVFMLWLAYVSFLAALTQFIAQ